MLVVLKKLKSFFSWWTSTWRMIIIRNFFHRLSRSKRSRNTTQCQVIIAARGHSHQKNCLRVAGLLEMNRISDGGNELPELSLAARNGTEEAAIQRLYSGISAVESITAWFRHTVKP
ncbi:hypothetical protein EVAR_58548_1 [Eumeta japonica]|uniref:Uncharacterized protein n=1 Tax=Eumeta variegata TaxID=151549 RepID=A0A4C1YGU2_EUMVA|nr:hypothetical protein EVAR_58548_1 [Eumeta japonica]